MKTIEESKDRLFARIKIGSLMDLGVPAIYISRQDLMRRSIIYYLCHLPKG